MQTFIRMILAVLVVTAHTAVVTAGSDVSARHMLLAQAQPEQLEQFTPIDQLPPEQQLPAAPLLIAAYVFVLLMLFGYLFIVSRRLTVIQREVERLDGDLKRTGRT
jgi:CcmD family protein